jgi:hypothetical protein
MSAACEVSNVSLLTGQCKDFDVGMVISVELVSHQDTQLALGVWFVREFTSLPKHYEHLATTRAKARLLAVDVGGLQNSLRVRHGNWII